MEVVQPWFVAQTQIAELADLQEAHSAKIMQFTKTTKHILVTTLEHLQVPARTPQQLNYKPPAQETRHVLTEVAQATALLMSPVTPPPTR